MSLGTPKVLEMLRASVADNYCAGDEVRAEPLSLNIDSGSLNSN